MSRVPVDPPPAMVIPPPLPCVLFEHTIHARVRLRSPATGKHGWKMRWRMLESCFVFHNHDVVKDRATHL